LTPLQVDNRPGLGAIAFRAGTFSSFREAMLERIAATPELAALKTRLSDDPAITVLELWATVADVLTFYQERIANEGFLRTARLRDSVLRMVQLIDYQLGPGAAATTMLAFTLEKGTRVAIPIGLRVQSVPGQDEQPQKFETLETLAADARLNRLRVLPEPVKANPLAPGNTEAYLAPSAALLPMMADLSPGDALVLFQSGSTAEVEELKVSELRLEQDRALLVWSGAVQATNWSGASDAFKFKRTFRLFGCAVPPIYMQPETTNQVVGGIKWTLQPTKFAYPADDGLTLDASYADIAVGSSLLVSIEGGNKILVTVTAVNQVAAQLGPASDTVTRVSVDPTLPAIGDRRAVRIYELSTRVKFWGYRFPQQFSQPAVYVPGRKIDADRIEVARAIQKKGFESGLELTLKDLEIGRRLLLTDESERIAPAALTGAEIKAFGTQDFLVLGVDAAVSVDPSNAWLLGNVVSASHGETVKEEVLGDGDASATFQHFDLKKKPLTYVPSAAPGGVTSTLRVLVNRALWSEVPSFYGQSPDAQVYTARIGDDGTPTIRFGDGVNGARPFSGRGNLVARYRHGIGLAGRVRAKTLTTLLDRPVGLKSATNPLPAEGGADPEPLDEARAAAPSTVRTFGRAVSVRDFEDLAKLSGEVAKARATVLWSGDGQAVHLTLAAQAAGVFSADALVRIHASLTAGRDPNHVLLLANFVRVAVTLGATLHVAATHVAADVEQTARAALLAALSFEKLQFGQPLHLSDVYEILQDVPGVVWLTVDRLQFKNQSPAYLASRGADLRPVQEHLRIYAARVVSGPSLTVLPAEQAWIEVPSQDVTLATSGGLPQ
jgi:uncharacterized phage protein gp47/JayE